MAEKTESSYEVFISRAQSLGLDAEDPHMKELFDYLQEVLPGLKKIEGLDLTGIEPMIPFILRKE